MDGKQLKALSVLGYNFWLHLFRSVLPRKKENQAEKFKGYFRSDWITSFRPEEIPQVYNFENCTVCGLCQPACLPMIASQGRFLGPEHLAACAGRSQPEYVSDLDDFLRCTLCGRCEPACPDEVKISELALLMRKWIFRVDPAMTWSLFPEARKNLDQFGNPFGKEQELSARPSGKNGRVLFPGCREMALGEPGKWVKLADKFGMEAELLSGACCGGFFEEIGAEGVNPGLEKILARNPQEVITVCPHCYYRLSKKLPPTVKVRFLLELIPEKAAAKANGGKRVMFHDPCFLGRKMGMLAQPRNLIQQLGFELMEFKESKDLSECCGGGGGLFWHDPEMASRVSALRVAEAQKAGVSLILTECGLCRELMQKAGSGAKIEVKRISDFFV